MDILNISEIQNGSLAGLLQFSFTSAAPASMAGSAKRPKPQRQLNALFLSENLENYLAKCHQAFQKGIGSIYNVRFFDPVPVPQKNKLSVEQIAQKAYPLEPLDIVFEYCAIDSNSGEFAPYLDGMADFDGIYCLLLCDFWNLRYQHIDAFIHSILRHKVDYILTYFPHPLNVFKDTPLADRTLYLLPCFDPEIFTDWQVPKQYDVSFLAAGTQEYSPFYPERYLLHKKLAKSSLRYLSAPHPAKGSFFLQKNHPLMGKGFSQHLNACLGSINTGGIYKTPNPRSIEILASHTCLFAFEHFDRGRLHLEDGKNYVAITYDNALDKIEYYLNNPGALSQITEAGYRLAMKEHSCFVRAKQFEDMLFEVNNAQI